MMKAFRKLPLVAVLMCLTPNGFAEVGSFTVEERFLSIDYALMKTVRQEEGGVDLIYTAPNAFERLGQYIPFYSPNQLSQ